MELVKAEKGNFEKAVGKAAKFIREGKVVVLPTDTVYGLVADAANKKAVEKIFKIKKRPIKNPLPVFVKDIKMAKKYAEVNEKQEKFLKKVWPGEITVVFKKIKRKKIYGVDKKTIALRIPKYKLINALLEKLNHPLTGTSANISGRPALTEIKKITYQFKNQKDQPDFIIDAGNLPKSRPSKIIDLTGKNIKILRE